MNKVILIGRLTKDPISGNNNAKFTVAVNRMKKDEADFISCVAFGKTADTIVQYMTKGSPIAIEGRIQTGSYTKDGETKYTTDVIVDRFEFIGGAKNEGQAPRQGGSPYSSVVASYDNALDTEELALVDNGDIPF